jgi:hypothetical protein
MSLTTARWRAALEYALCSDTGFCITHNTPLFLMFHMQNMGMKGMIIKYLDIPERTGRRAQ